MAGAVSDEVTQKDMLGAVATMYRSEEWRVVTLHNDRTNPGQQSGPDFLVMRNGEARALKVSLRKTLTDKQLVVARDYLDCGMPYIIYRPGCMVVLANHASAGDRLPAEGVLDCGAL